MNAWKRPWPASTPPPVVELALKNRSEEMGRALRDACSTSLRPRFCGGKKRLADYTDTRSPPAPEGGKVTLEGDEGTCVGENLPPL